MKSFKHRVGKLEEKVKPKESEEVRIRVYYLQSDGTLTDEEGNVYKNENALPKKTQEENVLYVNVIVVQELRGV